MAQLFANEIATLEAQEIDQIDGGVIPFAIGLILAAGTGGGLAALVLAAEDALGGHNHYS